MFIENQSIFYHSDFNNLICQTNQYIKTRSSSQKSSKNLSVLDPEKQVKEKKFLQKDSHQYINSSFLNQYQQRLIGRSSNSKIFELKDQQDELIGKVIKQIPHKVSHIHQPECYELQNEYYFLKRIQHRNIISVEDEGFVNDRNFCGLVLPQAQYNLMELSKAQRHGKISLFQIRIAFRQIASAIQYLHSNQISHNDIKPDNIFCFEENHYKLADFGFSVEIPQKESYNMQSENLLSLKKDWKVRSRQYVAPELIKILNGKRPRVKNDFKACDTFALGVSFFVIIFYQLPFNGAALKTDQRYKYFFRGQHQKFWAQFKSILERFEQQKNSHVDELIDLFNKMIEPDQKKRINIDEVIEHQWLNY